MTKYPINLTDMFKRNYTTMMHVLPKLTGSGWTIMTDPDAAEQCGFESVPKGCVIVYFDWTLDELDEEQRNAYHLMDDGFSNDLHHWFEFVDDNIGSGGGLEYGAIILKPRRGEQVI
jgi:hypothetical protein